MKTSPLLSVNNLCYSVGSENILYDVSFDCNTNDWLMLVGPNGAGKSSLVHCLSRCVDYKGDIKLYNKNIKNYKNIDYAKKIAFLSQKNFAAFDFSVEEIVSMGRYCHQDGIFRNLSNNDKNKINDAISVMGLENLRKNSILNLSGGEIQRTFIAQIIAQDTEILVLDEPTNNLDLIYQEQIFNILQKWIKNSKGTIISVVHDIALAKYYGNKAVLLNKGKVQASGLVENVLNKNQLNKVYDMDISNYFNKIYKGW